MDMRLKIQSSSGFTLVELGMVLVVFSLIIGPVFTYLTHKRDQENYYTTIDRQRKIAVALSNFANQYGHIPCPARTATGTGTEDSRVIGLAAESCNNFGSRMIREGIVPFITLGLSQEDAHDGYSNLFSYIVSSHAHWKPEEVFSGARAYIHPPCYGTATDTIPKYKKWGTGSKFKAHFCCGILPNKTTDQEVRISVPLDPLNPQTGTHKGIDGTTKIDALDLRDLSYDRYRSELPTTEALLKDNMNVMAYALISHGKNGDRAPYFDTKYSRQARLGGGVLEQFSTNGHHRVADYPINTKYGPDYFDDIVLWRTRWQVISETGTNTCASP